MGRVAATRTLENWLRRVGFVHVAGTDEVGRGCLAGPVVAAAVVLHPDRHISGLADSKAVPAEERAALFGEFTASAIAWSVGAADPTELDRINIHQPSLLEKQRPVRALARLAASMLGDAVRVPV